MAESYQVKPDWSLGVWAENGNDLQPSTEKISEGWKIEKPLNEQMNWVQNRQDTMLSYINQRGICEWDYKTSYPIGAFVSHNDVLYKASVENVDKDPTSNPDVWFVPFAYYNDFADLTVKVNATINEDGYLTHYVQKNAPVMDAPCKGVSYLNSTGVSGLSFSGTTPQVNKNSNVVAIFDEVVDYKESSKKVVTMDVLQKMLEFYKVGDLYLTTNIVNPSVTLGYGTWERFSEGRALVGVSSDVTTGTPDWAKILKYKFGEYTHKLLVSELPIHNVDFPADDQLITAFDLTRSTGFQRSGYDATSTMQTSYNSGWAKTSTIGGDVPHNIVQPSTVIAVWVRTA